MPGHVKELIAKFKDKPLDFKPGEKFQYSNSGYFLLGQIIEKVSGKNYAAFLKEAIFDPLGDEGHRLRPPRRRPQAPRLGLHPPAGHRPVNCDYLDMSIPHAAGSLYSTVEDLLKWDQALDTDKLVSKEVVRGDVHAVQGQLRLRLGASTSKFGRTRYAHGGGIKGFVTIIERYPGEKLLVVVLSNLENSAIGAIGDDLAAIALGEPYVIPREPQGGQGRPGVYDAYVGRYEADVPGKGKEVIAVSRDGPADCQPKGKSRVVLVPESETSFYSGRVISKPGSSRTPPARSRP